MFSDSTSVLNSISTQVNSQIGLVVANTIIFLWFVSLISLLTWDLSQIPMILIILAVLIRSFLHTGLFITTHEAIHGVISKHKIINNLIGYITSFLYAILP